MPDRRNHRGPHPEDAELLAARHRPVLSTAVAELSWLLSRDFPPAAALKLVGDRHRLDERQRQAVRRASCSDAARDRRRVNLVAPELVSGEALLIDGFNLLTTIEAALAGGVVLRCRDGCFRDMASVHGTWRRVDETTPALEKIGVEVERLGASGTHWLLDQPVSNSGRLKRSILEYGERRGWSWCVDTVRDPDPVLRRSAAIVVSADSGVLDHAARWLDLARLVVERAIPDAWVLDLTDSTGSTGLTDLSGTTAE